MGRALTLRELNRTTLLRQLLLKHARMGVVPAIARLGGLQAQWAPSPYIALWSRIERFHREQLERALRRDAVVKATLMRATLHLVSGREYPLFAAAVRDAQLVARTRGVSRPPDAAIREAVELARERPVTRRDLLAILGHESARPDRDPEPFRRLHWLLVLGQLEQTPDAAMWSPARVVTFRRREVELPSGEEGRVHLARRYLAAYGPASRADLSQWSGIPIRDLDPALEWIRLRRFEDETGRELLDLRRAPLAGADVAAPVRFLPRWDEVILAYQRRERILSDEYRRAVIATNGDVHQTFLVDGFVAGLWKLESGRVVLEPFAPLPMRVRRDVEDEARRLEVFVR